MTDIVKRLYTVLDDYDECGWHTTVREAISEIERLRLENTMTKPPQDVFHMPDDSVVKPLVPRIEVALTVPDGVDVQVTINGVGVLTTDDEEDDLDAGK